MSKGYIRWVGIMMCKHCAGLKGIFVGGLLLLNAFVWPLWTGIDGWLKWIGILMVVGGALKLILPACPNCVSCKCAMMPAEKSKK